MKILHALGVLAAPCVAPSAFGQEPDHAIHEELRGVLREVVAAIDGGQYDKMLPYLTENVEATSVTQEVMSGRADVSKYFKEWFGPTGYMRTMEMKLDADALTELSRDKSWGLVRGKSFEHYEAKGQAGDDRPRPRRLQRVQLGRDSVAARCVRVRHVAERDQRHSAAVREVSDPVGLLKVSLTSRGS